MPTRLPPTIRTGTSMSATLLLNKQLAVVFVVLANEFVDLVQVWAKRKRPADGPGAHEHVGIFERRVVLECIEIRTAESFDDVQRLAVVKAAQCRPRVEADYVHHQRVAFPAAYGVAHPSRVGIHGMRGAIGRGDSKDPRILMHDHRVGRSLQDLELIRHCVGRRPRDGHAVGKCASIVGSASDAILFQAGFQLWSTWSGCTSAAWRSRASAPTPAKTIDSGEVGLAIRQPGPLFLGCP